MPKSRKTIFITVVTGIFLTGCGNDQGQLIKKPDAVDSVRQMDLTPRFPTPDGGNVNNNTQNNQERYKIYGNNNAAQYNTNKEKTKNVNEKNDDDLVTLNFENTDITVVAKGILGDILNVNYTIDQSVQGTVSLYSAGPIHKRDVLPFLESALRFANAVLVHDGNIFKIVSSGDAIGSTSVDRAGNIKSGYGLTIIPVKYISVQVLMHLLDSFATKPGSIKIDRGRNLIIVQGTASERMSAVDIAQSLDADWMKDQSVGVFPIIHASAETIIGELNKILDTKQGGEGEGVVSLQPITRMNAVIAIARTRSSIEKIAGWIRNLDKVDYPSTGFNAYRLRYGDAKKIAAILNDVFVGKSSGSTSSAGQRNIDEVQPGGELASAETSPISQGNKTNTSGQVPSGNPDAANAMIGGSGIGKQQNNNSSNSKLPESLQNALDDTSADAGSTSHLGSNSAPLPEARIVADTTNNSLLIYATKDHYKIIEQAIIELDRTPLQVSINATIAEVTLNDELQYGVQFYMQSRDINIGADKGSFSFLNAGGLPLTTSTPGLNLLIGSQTGPSAIINALRAITNIKILSSPSLVVLNNQIAVLEVGNQIPVTTSSATIINSATNTGTPIVNSVDFKDTGVILRVLPRININGMVSLAIEQEVSSVVNNTTTSSQSASSATSESTSGSSSTQNLTPTISERKIRSSVIVASGQTVLLGGLISDQEQDANNSVPILSDIPIIGNIFKQKDRTKTRTELIVFIKPQIISNSVDAHMVADEFRSKLDMMRDQTSTYYKK